MTAQHDAPFVPASFNPLLEPADALAASWLAEVTLRLRRELAWLWQLGPARPADALGDSIDRLRHAGARQQFFDTDVTARYLGEQLAAVRAQRGAPANTSPRAPRGTPLGAWGRSGWARAVQAAGLDEAAQFVLALALAARADAGFGAVAAACQADANQAFASLALAQRLWPEPLAVLACADPAHPLYRHGLLRAPGADPWHPPLDVPATLAPLLLDPQAPLPAALQALRMGHEEPSAVATDPPIGAPLLAWLQAWPPTALQVLPLVLPPGGDARGVAQALARASGEPVAALAPDIGPEHPALPGLAATAWLAGHMLLAPDGWPTEPLAAALAPLAALPLRLLLPVGDAAALRGLPERWKLPPLLAPALAPAARRAQLATALPPALAPSALELARRFRFNERTLARATATIAALPEPTASAAQAVCQAAATLDMGHLAQPVQPRFNLPDLVLPARQQAALAAICDAMRALARVHHDWGSAQAWNEAGIAVMFCGPPGTGKTMAAEALASALALPMFRIDLSQVVNKYIGETEKNLRRIFDAAESADCLLFFDEADALFGKRTEVKDAHDRYANIEVSYLLERMERFKGLAVLATNRRKDIDEAFARRLRFVVEFPLPGAAERERLWRTMFPPAVDLSGLDFGFIAQRFELAGGPIRSAAFNACLQSAARQPTPQVAMPEVLVAIQRELEKAGRPTQREQFGHYAHLLPEYA